MPRRSEQAFLAARFTYDRNVPLNASTMRVYVDGAYAGVTQMPDTLPQADITMPMGEDDRVEVRVTDQGVERGQEGIIGRSNVESTHYLFEVTNRRPSATPGRGHRPVPGSPQRGYRGRGTAFGDGADGAQYRQQAGGYRLAKIGGGQ
ncbi:MAG: hypothetical protein U5K76_12155 [Woeseiaceae bacterium]|nr:hypothetical protein [Woeseiaceae bacterium]